MNQLDPTLARHEIDRRLRAADHHRRVRWARNFAKSSVRPPLSGRGGC